MWPLTYSNKLVVCTITTGQSEACDIHMEDTKLFLHTLSSLTDHKFVASLWQTTTVSGRGATCAKTIERFESESHRATLKSLGVILPGSWKASNRSSIDFSIVTLQTAWVCPKWLMTILYPSPSPNVLITMSLGRWIMVEKETTLLDLLKAKPSPVFRFTSLTRKG